MWRVAARRFAIMLAVVSTGIVVISYLLGLALGSAADRSISLGFYFVGAFLAFAGFFVGNRGPIRPVGEDSSGGGLRLGRGLRRASQEEQQESVAIGGLLAVLGFVLLAIGVAVDSRYQLV